MKNTKMVLFTNWLTIDFVGIYGKISEIFKPGQSKYVEDWKGLHYAKHLVDQYMNGKEISTNDVSRKEYEQRCFGEKIETFGNTESVIYNKNKELEEESTEKIPSETVAEIPVESKIIERKPKAKSKTQIKSEDKKEFVDLKK